MLKKIQRVGVLCCGLMSFSSLPAQSQPFLESSIGAAFHTVEVSETSSLTSVGEYVSFSAGVQAKSTLSLSMSLRLWSTEDDEDQSDIDHAFLHDFHFTGISLGVETQVFIPSFAQGPYVKLGRHCWAVDVVEVINIWDGSGCSNIAGVGWLWNPDRSYAKGMFTEITTTRFKYVDSWMLIAGVRF